MIIFYVRQDSTKCLNSSFLNFSREENQFREQLGAFSITKCQKTNDIRKFITKVLFKKIAIIVVMTSF